MEKMRFTNDIVFRTLVGFPGMEGCEEGSDVICWHSFFQQAAPDFVKTRFWEVPKMNTCLPCLPPQHLRQPLLAGQGHSHRLQLQEIRK